MAKSWNLFCSVVSRINTRGKRHAALGATDNNNSRGEKFRERTNRGSITDHRGQHWHPTRQGEGWRVKSGRSGEEKNQDRTSLIHWIMGLVGFCPVTIDRRIRRVSVRFFGFNFSQQFVSLDYRRMIQPIVRDSKYRIAIQFVHGKRRSCSRHSIRCGFINFVQNSQYRICR